MSILLIAPPTEEPVSLASFKEHLKLDGADEDASLEGFLLAARRTIEARHALAMLAQTWRLTLRCASGTVLLPLSPVISIDSVAISRGGVTEALPPSAYDADTGAAGRVKLKAAYPDAALVIVFTAGWGSAAALPEELKLAVKVLAGFLYERRDGEGPDSGAEVLVRLLSAYRQVRL